MASAEKTVREAREATTDEVKELKAEARQLKETLADSSLTQSGRSVRQALTACTGEKKYYLANPPAATDLRTLAATIKARWIGEQAHQRLKEELGLDHFEGRSWQGLHRHALMTMLAFAFLQFRRLKRARRGKKYQWTAAKMDWQRKAA